MPAEKPTLKNKVDVRANLDKATGDLKDAMQELISPVLDIFRNWDRFSDIVTNNILLGQRHLQLGNVKDAIMRFRFALWLAPSRADAWDYLGRAFFVQGDKPKARAAFQKSLKLRPGNEEVAYMLAVSTGKLLSGADMPARIPKHFLLQHFNQLAPGFSVEQVENYQYRGHALAATALRAAMTAGRMDHIVLDLGCGSGLFGPLMRDVSARIVGVDQAPAMLAEAVRQQDSSGSKIYDELIENDAVTYLKQTSDDAFDIVAALALPNYLGDLQALFTEAARVLKAGGLFVLTADATGSELCFDGAGAHYRFSSDYLARLAAGAGLKQVKLAPEEIYPGSRAWLGLFRK